MASASTTRNLGDEARAELAELIDAQMSPLGLAAMAGLAPLPGQIVLDVGCGAGETILQLAERVGETGRVVGVDVAPCVLNVARARTRHLPQVTLLQEDAATLSLPGESFDGIYSRFGIMFFADPYEAFSNMRRMLKRRGKIGFVCWRSVNENELDLFPVQAAGLSIGADAAPFSFESADTIKNILLSAGFEGVAVDAHDCSVSSGGIDAMLEVVTRVGALGMILRAAPSLLPKIKPQVRAALAARESDGKVSLQSATWIVTATAM
jgi:SAM-dependent methyltransferase